MRVQERPTVAVVGAGFSGLLTALHLLAREDGPRVRLIERRAPFARGAAYASPDAVAGAATEPVLNVRAANMSAFPDDPGHFLAWLGREDDVCGASDFVSRRRYGDYLQAILRQAAERTEAGRLILEPDAAVGAREEGSAWRVRMAMGREFAADALVLAVGNLPPHAPPGFTDAAQASAAYVADPWLDGEALPAKGLAVLLGTGLTMVDVALRLAEHAPGLRMLALSRRGLLPRRHLDDGAAPEPWTPREPDSVLGVLRDLRRRSRGGAWRSALDGLRPQVQGVWHGWPHEERARFLRHARPMWDVHRHRLAPAVAQRLDHLMACGALAVSAGRIQAVTVTEAGLDVAWTPRGVRTPRRSHAVRVVNCTGPQGDLARSGDALLSSLAQDGHLRADACRLGLDVDLCGRLIGRDGRASPSLFAVGPITRGALWEATSVPDIRVQAAQCAEHIRQRLAGEGPEPGRASCAGLMESR